jgi:ABC-type phosphate/phosphonate transport system substrate-binding protein
MKSRVLLCLWFVLFFIASGFAADIKTLHMGYHLPSLHKVSQKDIKICLDFWGKELGRKSGLTVENHYYQDIHRMRDDLKAGKLDTVNASLPLFSTQFASGMLHDGFKLVTKGQEDGVEMLLIAKGNSADALSLKDFRHKTLVMIKDESLEKLYLDLILERKFHQTTDIFFKKIMGVKKYNAAIVKLFFNKADIGLVSKRAFDLAGDLNPQVRQKLHIVYRFIIKANNATFFRESPKLCHNMNFFREIALHLHQTVRGKQILEVFNADYILENSLDDVTYVREMQKELARLKQQRTKAP